MEKYSMSAPINKESYPKYFKKGNTLLAFVSPTEMYKIEAIGSNKNEGITIDHYITRTMVLKHWGGLEIKPLTFKDLVTRLYKAYIEKILSA